MFEEVPRERRGVARVLLVRHVVLGPFVIGGGMLLAALGGSVAVAAAATVITASALSSNDLPARPGQVTAAASASDQPTHSANHAPAHRQGDPLSSASSSAAGQSAGGAAGTGTAGGSAPGGWLPGGSASNGVSLPSSANSATSSSPAGTARSTAASPSTANPTPSPSSSGPLGNALIHVSGHDPASGRLVYQFATVQPGAGPGGADLYRISAPATFTAVLAPSVTITSGGGICAPAGGVCTPNQLIRAADSGFFAEAAIDAGGQLRSITEVATGQVSAKLAPAPSTSASSGDLQAQLAPSSAAPRPATSAAPATSPAASAAPAAGS